MQLQNVIGKLQSSGAALPDETQQLISHAQNLTRDVTAARQVPSLWQFLVRVLVMDWWIVIFCQMSDLSIQNLELCCKMVDGAEMVEILQ